MLIPAVVHRLQVSEDIAEFYPPTIHVDDDSPKKEERQGTDDLQDMVDVEEKKARPKGKAGQKSKASEKSKPGPKTRQKKEKQQDPVEQMEVDQAPVSILPYELVTEC